jgi:crotonobetainyl-CoA:carnitine CoA-transferase CaiB-like acyl-CoA transferase
MAMKGDGAPLGVPIADLAGATYALAALQAALLQRTRTGRGQHLDVSLTDCAAHWMNPRQAALHDNGGDAARVRWQVQQRPGYGVFRCRDGEYISIAALEDHIWQALVHTLPLPGFDAKSRYADRVPQAADINEAIAAAVVKEDMASALERRSAPMWRWPMSSAWHRFRTPTPWWRDGCSCRPTSGRWRDFRWCWKAWRSYSVWPGGPTTCTTLAWHAFHRMHASRVRGQCSRLRYVAHHER